MTFKKCAIICSLSFVFGMSYSLVENIGNSSQNVSDVELFKFPGEFDLYEVKNLEKY